MSASTGAPTGPAGPTSRLPLLGFIAAIAAAAAAATWTLASSSPPGVPAWAALPLLAALLVAAESLFVKFRYAGEINALNLVEAALAPLLFAFPPTVVVATVAATQFGGYVLRRNAPVKAAFNSAQWSLAACAGIAVLHGIADGDVSVTTLIATVLALAAVAVVNQTLFTLVLAIANRDSIRHVLRGLSGAIIPGWIAGWIVNSVIGILFVLAYSAHAAAVLVFPVPLVVLHLAYRGYAGARSDRVRLAGLHRAASVLAEPLDPHAAIGPFLREVARSFEASGAELVLRVPGGYETHTLEATDERPQVRLLDDAHPSLEGALLHQSRPVRVAVAGGGPLGDALRRAGWRDCLAAPLLDEGRVVGALIVFDQVGLEGFEAGEIAVIEAVARETAGALAKGRLLSTILEERTRIARILASTSDGIFSVAADGTVRSWNPAMERITGLPATDVLDKRDPFRMLDAHTERGAPVVFDTWVADELPPASFRITRTDGATRHLACTFNRTPDTTPAGDDGSELLVVVARDVTPEEEIEQLRREFGRLAEAEATQRAIVEQLQRALVPSRPDVAGVQLGVRYEASDPAAPTGGDLYDWQLLPDGELHVVVVDVLGHGVAATKHALSVVHTLRTLALDGCPLERIVARAHDLLQGQDPDLVATLLVVRYDPGTGHARIAGGGHPPALHVSANGVRQIAAPGGAIGWPYAGSEQLAAIDLAPGDALVLYTDGLIEARKNILEGEEALERHARALTGMPAQEMATSLVQRALEPGERRDDSMALVLRRAPALERETWHVAPDPVEIRALRREARRWLSARGARETDREDVLLIASELLANAMTAARHDVRFTLVLEPTTITVEVEDDGPGCPDIETRGHGQPLGDLEAGRGLFIVRSLSDALTFMTTSAGTLVRSVKQRDLSSLSTAREAERTHDLLRPGHDEL